MNDHTYCVIMAGGTGTRFWPISRTEKPKQFLDILGTGKTFLRSTYERFAGMIPPEHFLVVTNTAYRETVLQQLPELNANQVLCEPLGRNTAPCITYAAFRLRATDPDAVMIVTPSDHFIQNETVFCDTVRKAAVFAADSDALVTIGVKPTRPATGYGYIQVEQPILHDGINKVKTFTEKPNEELATAFIRSGDFFWNSGIFIWKAETILRKIEELLPDTYQMFSSIERYYASDEEQRHIDALYPECRSISIDYGVMEKTDNVYVLCGDFGWSDIGTWGSLYDFASKDDRGNASGDNAMLFDTSGCLVRIHEGKLAVIDGLTDFIVVNTDDVLLVCPKSHEQNIKKFIDAVKFTDRERFI